MTRTCKEIDHAYCSATNMPNDKNQKVNSQKEENGQTRDRTPGSKAITTSPATKKPHLVIIHSSPGNSIILKGLYDFLANYFVVHPIDLPGFIEGKEQLQEINFEGYCRHVENEIKALKLTEPYIIGGISFAVANRCKLEANCKAVLAVAPFINADYLQNNFRLNLIKRITNVVIRLNMYKKVYYSYLFVRLLQKKGKISPERTATIRRNIEPHTFFKTSKMLMADKTFPIFHPDKKYVLVINDEDTTINGEKIRSLFEQQENTLIIKTDLEHHPQNISKAHFQQHIPAAEIEKIIAFIQKGKDKSNP